MWFQKVSLQLPQYEIAILAQGNISISPDFFQSFLSVNNFSTINAPNESNTDFLNYSNINGPDYSQHKDNNEPNSSKTIENKETKKKNNKLHYRFNQI